jgi:hypothetical protein
VLQHIGSLILKLGCLVFAAMGRCVVPDLAATLLASWFLTCLSIVSLLCVLVVAVLSLGLGNTQK